jgi:hypothetical protein
MVRPERPYGGGAQANPFRRERRPQRSGRSCKRSSIWPRRKFLGERRKLTVLMPLTMRPNRAGSAGRSGATPVMSAAEQVAAPCVCGHSPGPIPKTFRSMRVIADTCGCGWEISMPVLGGAANDPKIVLPAVNRSHDLFRSHLLRLLCYRWPFRIKGALSDRWRDRWHLDHVFLVK